MRSYIAKTSVVVLFVALAVLVTGLTRQGQSRDTTQGSKRAVFKQRELPIVDFDAPEPADPAVRTRLREKAKRYDNYSSQPIQEAPAVSGRIWSSHWARGLSALPVDASDVVVIGSVTNAAAHLSNDKTGVYSQFRIAIQELLKDKTETVAPSDTLSVQRFGGAVRFRSGRIQTYESQGQGMPVVGRTYLLFLKCLDSGPDYSLITAYDVSGSTVEPLDGSAADETTQKYQFDKYRGIDLSSFLREVRSLIPSSPV